MFWYLSDITGSVVSLKDEAEARLFSSVAEKNIVFWAELTTDEQ